MRRGEGELVELGKAQPAAGEGQRRDRNAPGGAKDLEGDAVTGNRVPDGAKGFQGGGAAAEGSQCRSFEAGLTGRHFNVWELPQVRIYHSGRPLANQETSLLEDDKGREAPRAGLRPARRLREFPDAALTPGEAMLRDRADHTAGLARSADDRAQFHKRLVEVGAAGRGR